MSGMRRVPVPEPKMSAFVETACVFTFCAQNWIVEMLLANIAPAERPIVEPVNPEPIPLTVENSCVELM